jgi:hypothetical protein
MLFNDFAERSQQRLYALHINLESLLYENFLHILHIPWSTGNTLVDD